ncbi:SLBB domain-containing protein [Rhizobium sp. CECT 9324]|uniref:polysaccharide biosynthesis/export family protein n=1 Tax=Rhizobium sp. CECT 9324 TaxID=2845820 RepID=UPI001E545186|nr:SLBB domain-containing protein [Rhizobium sp. CECT 9324]
MRYALAFVLLLPTTAVAEEPLRPQTRIKLTIVEWVASTGEYKEWTALNGEYAVSSGGTIAVPLLGEFPVGDDTPSTVALKIGQLLKNKTGLSAPPVATVEIVRYPMFYVSGVVAKPGEQEYRPGLTITQAVAMAGGRERRANPNGSWELEQVRYAGELNRFDLALKQLMAKRARLEAELKDSPRVEFPDELVNTADSSASKLTIDSESALFVARAEALKRQLASLTELQVLLQNEISVLDEKTAVQDRQIKIAQDELKSIASLVDSGTLAKSRETALERVVADLSSDKLDLVIAAMRAKQKLSETQRDAITLRGQRRTEAGRDLQEVLAELEDTKLKRKTTIDLLQATGASVSRDAALEAGDLQPLEYWVTRVDGSGVAQKLPPTADLEPGDVLDVRYDISSSMTVAHQTAPTTGPSQ